MSAILKKVGEQALDTLENTIKSLTELLSTSFSKTPSEIQKQYLDSFADTAESLANAELKALKTTVADKSAETVEMLRNLQLWIQLLIPKIEDGNNFGVAIQMELVKRVSDRTNEMEKVFEDMFTYHDQRAGIVEKLIERTSKEVKTNVVVESVEKDKTGTNKTETETVASKSGTPEHLEALAAIDLRLYLKLKGAVRAQRDYLVYIQDFVEKNEKKLKNPRGSTTSSYTY